MRGRPPTPTKLKILRNNPGHRPLRDDVPQPFEATPTPPEWLSAEARTMWDATAPEMIRLGLLTVLDVAAFAVVCDLVGDLQALDRAEAVYRAGELIKRNPTVAIRDQLRRTLLVFLREFGMTPASRERIHLDPLFSAADPLAEKYGR